VVLAIVSTSVACDQATKELAIDHLKGHPPIELGPARLLYAENPGAFLGLGGDLPPAARQLLFLVLAGLLVLGGAYWLVKEKHNWPILVGGALMVGGGLGNLIDRTVREGGRVVDFAQLEVGPLATGIFNVADVFLMAALPIFLLWGPYRDKSDGPPEPIPEGEPLRG
jgi:signal peptidase II